MAPVESAALGVACRPPRSRVGWVSSAESHRGVGATLGPAVEERRSQSQREQQREGVGSPGAAVGRGVRGSRGRRVGCRCSCSWRLSYFSLSLGHLQRTTHSRFFYRFTTSPNGTTAATTKLKNATQRAPSLDPAPRLKLIHDELCVSAVSKSNMF